MPTNAESGIRRNETHYVREELDDVGDPVTPTDPDFSLYSSVVESTGGEAGIEYEERTGLGNVVAVDKQRTQESHEHTVTYDLERFPVDGSGDAVDPFADVALRDIDNKIQYSHTIVDIEKKASIITSNTVHHQYFEELGNNHPAGEAPAATVKATRLEVYARGGVPGEPTLTVDPGDSAIIGVELPYTFGKIRKYQFDQPDDAGSTLHLRSTNSDDTEADVEIEAVDGSESETISLDSADATTTVSTSTTFPSLRASVPEELEGTLEIYAEGQTAGEPGQLLGVIFGKAAYDGIEGDRGPPPLGSGSWGDGSTLGTPQTAVARKLEWDGSPAAENVMSTTITVANSTEENNTDSGLAMDIRGSLQEITAESTVFGETESIDKFGDHIRGREGELRLPMQGGELVIPRCYCQSGGSTSRETEQAVMQVEVAFRALMPEDGSDPLQFVTS